MEDARISRIIWHLARRENAVVAISRSFPRIVADEFGRHFPVLALASVCTHPEHRGQGLGRSMVTAAWSRLNPGLPVSFFQTGVPAFYEKMGARHVRNSLCNGKGDSQPFWEPYAMIYPANAPWPESKIDLLGPGW